MRSPATTVGEVRVTGPLGSYASAFRSKLTDLGYTPLTTDLGYTPLTTARLMRTLADWSRWLEEQSCSAADVTSELVRRFVAARRAAGRVSPYSPRLFDTVFGILVDQGVIRPEDNVPVPGSGLEPVLSAFRQYLLGERGLAPSTAAAYELRVRRFLDRQAPAGTLSELTAKDVTDAVRAEAALVSVGSTQFFVVAVRSFLRFCFLDGLTTTDLSGAALAVTGRRRSPLATGISPVAAQGLLDSCDRQQSEGLRDHAILVLLLRLGLRASEVAALSLDDIDWRSGSLVIHGKGRRDDRLPLPADVGQAITDYLQHGRPRSPRREVFLRLLAPVQGLGRGGISTAVRRACRRSGITPVGAHRLRHTLARELINSGAPLPEIAQVLRHRSLASTALYARVDIAGLRSLARPWPGGEQ